MDYTVKNVYGKTSKNPVAVRVPGSKSITARAFLIAAAAKGESVLYGAQFSDDCKTFLNCLEILGIGIKKEKFAVKINGCGGVPPVKSGEVYVGSAGTAARFLPAFLAFSDGTYTLTCSDQMKKRPVAPLVSALEKLGAKFTFKENKNSYPFIIEGTKKPCLELNVDVTKSSQYLSALLISSVCAGKPVEIEVNGEHGRNYVDMTVAMMRDFGASVKEEDGKYVVCGGYSAREYSIEPDVSAACYFYAMNKILGTEISVEGITGRSLQGDMNFINILKTFDGGEIDMGAFSDQALTMAAIAPYLSAPTRICGVKHIRGQECDRINAAAVNLSAMGVKCEEFDDGLTIYPSAPQPAKIQTFGDHRVAMSFALTGLRADGIIITDAQVCSKTFKEYFEVLDSLCDKLVC